jgi:hypothetical protein
MVTTRAVTPTAKIQKHGAAKAAKITNHQHHPHRNSGYPPDNNINLHITELNLNHLRFKNVQVTLGTPDEAACPANVPTDPLDGADDLTLPLNESMDSNPGATGMTLGTGAVRIDDSLTHDHPSNPTPYTQPTQPPRSILGKSTNLLSLQLNGSTSDETQFLADFVNNGKGKVIHDKIHKVSKEMTGYHYTEFHIRDFGGLFPIWLIAEFALAPSGTSNDKRMTQYVYCVLALFGEIMLVDKKAAIAPIKITNDKAEDLITDKSNIPSNFTKLGKWLMMSRGSWVFDKANNNIYACFCLKSTVLVEDMVT